MTSLYNSILVAIDGSNASEKAFRKAVEVAKQNNAEHFTLVHIIDIREFATYQWYNTVLDSASDYGNELLESYKGIAEEEGLRDVKTIIQVGSPKVSITRDIAPEVDSDLIVCGATGKNTVDRILIGSVSEHISRYAKCDVMIVRDK